MCSTVSRRDGSSTKHLSTRSRAAAGKPGGNSYSRLTIFWKVSYSDAALNGGRRGGRRGGRGGGRRRGRGPAGGGRGGGAAGRPRGARGAGRRGGQRRRA